MSQAALGEKLGVTDKAVSGWERDEATPHPLKIPLLRRELRVTYAWLFEGGNTPPAADAPDVLLEDLVQVEQDAVKAGITAMLKTLDRQRGAA